MKIKIFTGFRICGLGFSAFASNEKQILSNRIPVLKRSIMFHPAASIKVNCFAAHLVCISLASALLVSILGCSFLEEIAWNARGITSGGHLFFYPRKKTIDVREISTKLSFVIWENILHVTLAKKMCGKLP